MDKHVKLYKKALDTPLKPHKIAVYGIANYDDVFNISKEKLGKIQINTIFDDIASRVLKNKSYTEYNRDIDDINEAIMKLKNISLKEKVILGGNASNISLALSALGNKAHLEVKRATSDMVKQLKSEGIASVKSSIDKAAHHLIVQVKEDGDRFIISPDYGIYEPELVDFVDNTCDFAVYSGAHLDAKSEPVQAELLKRVKNISRTSKLYIELGSGSRMAKDNCRKVSKYADIVGMNEIELETMTGKKDIVEAAAVFHKKYMKSDSILVIHTMKGSLALSSKPIEGLPLAQALGHLSGSSRYIHGKYMSIGDMKKKFKNIILHQKEIPNKTKYHISWVAGILHKGEGLAVGSGDGYVAGFITGYLNFCKNHFNPLKSL